LNKQWLFRRLGTSAMVLVAAMIINFAIPRAMPGSPVDSILGGVKLTAEARQDIVERFGLDKSLPEQLVRYFVNTLKGDFGVSFYYYPKPVWPIIMQALPWTLLIVLLAQVLQLTFGYFLGVMAAWRVGSRFDSVIQTFSILVFSSPIFWVAMVFLYVFGFQLSWFPLGGNYTAGADYPNTFAFILDVLKHAALPIATLAFSRFAVYQIIMRNTMVGVIKEQYILTAEAKGMSQYRVKHRHAARNAMLPMVTFAGVAVAIQIGGSVYIETVFSYPGIGKLIFDSVISRDYPVLQGSFFILTLMVIIGTILVDFLYLFLDPRIKY
jgi:peptide/nickel transport system permease protein